MKKVKKKNPKLSEAPRSKGKNRRRRNPIARAKANIVARAIPNLPRLRAVFALRKLKERLSSDVISDGSIATKYKIPTHRPANLGTDIAVYQEQLLKVFRDVLSGKLVTSIVNEIGNRLPAKVSIAENGTAHIVINERGFAFAHAGLLNQDINTRFALLERYLKERTLAGVYAEELASLVSKPAMTDEDFLASVGILSASPESFVSTIRAKVTSRDLSNADLLPEDERHWDNLVVSLRDYSKTFRGFLRVECEEERARAFRKNPVQAFRGDFALLLCARFGALR